MDLSNRVYSEVGVEGMYYEYKGDVASERINAVLEELESKVMDLSNTRLRKKIYNIAVESLQNLYHHSDNVPEDLIKSLGNRFGIFIIKRIGDDFTLTVGNYVTSEKVALLTEKIDKINSLTADELKEMYKFILNYQKLSPKGGGGLGLIDIARKSENKLEYKFYPYNEKYYFYRLDIFITNLEYS